MHSQSSFKYVKNLFIQTTVAMTSSKPHAEQLGAVEGLAGDHVEQATKPSEIAFDAAAKGQATSGYESLTLFETIKTFKVATLVCFSAAFSAATDGYQIGYVYTLYLNSYPFFKNKTDIVVSE